jgi:hypothetical protein
MIRCELVEQFGVMRDQQELSFLIVRPVLEALEPRLNLGEGNEVVGLINAKQRAALRKAM